MRGVRRKWREITGMLRESMREHGYDRHDLRFLLGAMAVVWSISFVAGLAEGKQGVGGSMLAALISLVVAWGAMGAIAAVVLIADRENRISRRLARWAGFGGLDRGVRGTYLVLKSRLLGEAVSAKNYRDARRWVENFDRERELVAEGEMGYWTRINYRRMVAKVGAYAAEVERYRSSGQLLAELKRELLEGVQGWRSFHERGEPDHTKMLAIVKIQVRWFEWEDMAGIYLNEFSLGSGGWVWLIHDEAWVIEALEHGARSLRREGEDLAAVAYDGSLEYVGELWDPEERGFLHHPARVIQAARRLQQARRGR